ncbi:MAG: DUF975 family protein [Clostridia bacterium]
MKARECRKKACADLKGHRVVAFGVVFLGMGLTALASIVPIVGTLLVVGPLSLGLITYFFGRIHKDSDDKFSSLFAGFNNFGTAFLIWLLTGIYTFLWTLLLIVPGVIKQYSYAASLYLLKAHPEMGANEAITASRKLMKGNKWRYFCLQFSFIGWYILSFLTLGILLVRVVPYNEMANAEFFDELITKQSEKQAASDDKKTSTNADGFEKANDGFADAFDAKNEEAKKVEEKDIAPKDDVATKDIDK